MLQKLSSLHTSLLSLNLLPLQRLPSLILLIASSNNIVCCSSLIFLSSIVVVHFSLQNSVFHVVLLLHSVILRHFSLKSFLSQVRIIVLLLLKLLLTGFLICYCEVFVKTVTLYNNHNMKGREQRIGYLKCSGLMWGLANG